MKLTNMKKAGAGIVSVFMALTLSACAALPIPLQGTMHRA